MIAYIYLASWRIVRFLPRKIAIKLFQYFAQMAYKRNGKSVVQLRKNLAVVTKLSGDDLEQVVKLGMASYGRYWAEAFQLPSYSDKAISRLVRISNPEILLAPLKSNQGVIVAVPHLGNWDLAGRWFAKQAGEVITVAEALKPERVFDAFVQYRKSIGLIAYPAGSRSTVPALKQALESGKLIALVADRDMSSSGIEVEFCGEICTMPAGPASLAYATNSVLTTACLFNESDHLAGFIDSPIEFDRRLPREAAIKLATQQIADRFTQYVTEHPEDWHVLQRLWKIHA
jgi:phosphatidylinositol dimannoside acyltransferase